MEHHKARYLGSYALTVIGRHSKGMRQWRACLLPTTLTFLGAFWCAQSRIRLPVLGTGVGLCPMRGDENCRKKRLTRNYTDGRLAWSPAWTSSRNGVLQLKHLVNGAAINIINVPNRGEYSAALEGAYLCHGSLLGCVLLFVPTCGYTTSIRA